MGEEGGGRAVPRARGIGRRGRRDGAGGEGGGGGGGGGGGRGTILNPINPIPIVNPATIALPGFIFNIKPKIIIIAGINTEEPKLINIFINVSIIFLLLDLN